MSNSRARGSVGNSHNLEYRRLSSISERETPLEAELAKYLSRDELKHVLACSNKAVHIAALQNKTIKDLFANQEVVVLRFVGTQRALKESYV